MTPPEPDYHTWLEEHGHSLTPEQYAGHRNLLEEMNCKKKGARQDYGLGYMQRRGAA